MTYRNVMVTQWETADGFSFFTVDGLSDEFDTAEQAFAAIDGLLKGES